MCDRRLDPPAPSYHDRGDEAADEVEDQVPTGIFVATHVRVGNGKHGDEFNDLVERAETHASCSGQR